MNVITEANYREPDWMIMEFEEGVLSVTSGSETTRTQLITKRSVDSWKREK
ncbi:MAG: hypothetical protein JW697_05170 [Kosmotogaceae bacterium]|nr:hypothetical protein [Kosmotogaceae bacterium]